MKSKRPKSKSSQARSAQSAQSLRIIGGEWRGRKLPFIPAAGLRPTQDRFRETLFNWLMHDIEGRVCVDLFAGSGALGIEALSRGAKSVTFIDNNRQSARTIEGHLHTLGTQRGRVECMDALQWLRAPSVTQCDVVFLDPPFHQELLPAVLTELSHASWLNDHAHLYIEAEANFILPLHSLPHWRILKDKPLKNKRFYLLSLEINPS